MRVSLSCTELPADLANDLDLPPVVNTPLKRAFEALTRSLTHHPAMVNLTTGINPSHYPDIAFPPADAEILVEILLVPNRDAFAAFDIGGELMGVCLTSAGPLEEDSFLANKFRVLVLCDEDEFLAHVRSESEEEMDPCSDRYDSEYVAAYLNTLTHEVAHAVEFISHGHGLTPAQVEIWNDSGELDRDLEDIASGRWIRPDMQDDQFADDDFTNDVMESRVEAQGREWLSDCLSADAPHGEEVRALFNELCNQARDHIEEQSVQRSFIMPSYRSITPP